MITLQYVNDLAIACAKQTMLDKKLYLTPVIKRILKVQKFRGLFLLEFGNYLRSQDCTFREISDYARKL